jgi:hypothetical protein
VSPQESAATARPDAADGVTPRDRRRLAGLPAGLGSRERSKRPSGRRLWLYETTALILVGLALVVIVVGAVGHDSTGGRTPADTATWRRYTRDDRAAVSVVALNIPTTQDVACGDLGRGPAAGRPKLCVLIKVSKAGVAGPVIGGWTLPAGAPDVPAYRRDCFGATVVQGLCPREERGRSRQPFASTHTAP